MMFKIVILQRYYSHGMFVNSTHKEGVFKSASYIPEETLSMAN
jgi:hypothetical protein